MAGRKRSRSTGEGMTPLFDVEAFVRDDAQSEARVARIAVSGSAARATAKTPQPVDYWIRGRYRASDGKEQTHTVRAVGMSDQLEADVARFVRHLTEEGWQFPEGRAVLVEVLGVGSDDGVQISLSRSEW